MNSDGDGPTRNPTAGDRILLWLATGLGSGYAPVAPGTAGSLVGLVLALPLLQLPVWAYLAVTALVCGVGVVASDRAEAHFGRKDAGTIVIDEVAGMLLTLTATGGTVAEMVAGFLLFRLLDIVKPFPCRRAEGLKGGLGVMADDVVAGVYACLLLHLGVMALKAGGLG
jgi:phosphatidylglycerophosphatase A